MIKNTLCIVLVLLIGLSTASADQPKSAGEATAASTDGFVSLFDGKSLEGWKVSEENPGSWKVVDDTLMCDGPRAHLFYVGREAPMKNFHFTAEVKTSPNSNSGIYFHTQYQGEGWPKYGYECQVNLTHQDPKKTSSLYGVVNIDDPGLMDNEWYTQEIIVQGRHVELKVNGKTMVDYTEPENQPAFDSSFERRLGSGTIALQAHDPESKAQFRNLRVKKLAD
jgi:hypothetical protein